MGYSFLRMDHILFTRLIRFSWCLGIALIILPSLQAEPDLRLVAVYGKKEYPVKSIRPDEIEIEMPNGQIKALRRGFFFRLKGTAKPSLNIGYAPALYEISRAPTNHYFAGRRKAPDTYTLILSGRTKADNDPWWVETDLSKIWKPSALNPKKGILLLAWWNQKWERVRLTKVRGGRFDYNGDFRSRHLPGHPVILLWKNGRFIPPSVYQEAVAGSPFETIQKGDAGPALFDPKAKDPLGLSPAHYLASWGHTDAFASQPKNALKKVRWSRKHPTPLMLAAMHGHVATTESLIELGLSPTREMPGMGFDAGHLAILAGHSEVISAFIERGYSRRN